MRFDPVSRNGRRLRAITGRRLLDRGELSPFLGYAVTPTLLMEIARTASNAFREEAARECIDVRGWSVEVWNPDDIYATQRVTLVLVGPGRVGYSLAPDEVMAEARAASLAADGRGKGTG